MTKSKTIWKLFPGCSVDFLRKKVLLLNNAIQLKPKNMKMQIWKELI